MVDKKYINYIFLLLLLIIFITGISFLKDIKSGKYAGKINIIINTGSINHSKVKIFSLSRSNLNKIELQSSYKNYVLEKKYSKNIVFEFNNFKNEVDSIDVIIGDKRQRFSKDQIIKTWISNDDGITYYLPDDVFLQKSIIPIFYNIINYTGDLELVLHFIIKLLFNAFLLFIMVLCAVIFNFYFKNLRFIENIATKFIGFFKNNEKLFISFLIVGLLTIITILLFFTNGTRDVFTWLYDWWMPNYEKYGPILGYSKTGDNYPPLSFLLISFIGFLSNSLSVDRMVIFKSINLFFIVLAYLIFLIYTKDIYLSSLLYLFSIILSLGLGYIDVWYAPFIILSFFALEKREYTNFALFFSIGTLIKFQPLIILFFIIVHVIDINQINEIKQIRFKKILLEIVFPVSMLLIILFAVFGPHLIYSLIKATKHNSLSANALNINWLIANIINYIHPAQYQNIYNIRDIDYPNLSKIMKIMFYLFYFASLINFFRMKDKNMRNLLLFSVLGFLSYFVLNIGVHENHSFIIILLFALLVFYDKKFYVDFILWSILFNLNLIVFYGVSGVAIDLNSQFVYIYAKNIISALITLYFIKFYFINILSRFDEA